MLSPRPYQTALVEAVRQAYREKSKAVILQLPTGGGKTACAGIIAQSIADRLADGGPAHCLYLVHRKELVRQVQATLDEFGLGEQAGYLVPWAGMEPWKPFQIGSIQTVARRLDKLHWLKPRLIIIDEAHHARAASWEKVLAHWEDVRLLGLTATPARLDGRGLGTIFDRIVSGPSVRELIAGGYLCDFDLYSTPMDMDLQGVRKTAGDYNKGQLDKRATGTVIANAVKNWKRLAPDRRTIHYAVTRRHSKDFVAQMQLEGISAAHVDGETPSDLRQDIFTRFKKGTIQVVSNVELVTEGFDAPACDCVMLGRPTQSLTLYLQMVGRMMRPKEGSRGIILDLSGNVDRHGDPRSKYKWSLEDGADLVEENEEECNRSTVRVCQNCYFVYPLVMEECPLCGWKQQPRAVREVDVDLELKTPENTPAPPERPTRRALNRMVIATGGDLNKLREIQQKFGYKPTVIYQWHKIFGRQWNRR